MLRKTLKLNLAWEENQQFYREFNRRSGKLLSLYFRPTDQASQNSRATVVVGKKVSLLATQRNKSKRQIYQWLEKQKSWQSGQDIVIVLHRAADSDSYQAELDFLHSKI